MIAKAHYPLSNDLAQTAQVISTMYMVLFKFGQVIQTEIIDHMEPAELEDFLKRCHFNKTPHFQKRDEERVWNGSPDTKLMTVSLKFRRPDLLPRDDVNFISEYRNMFFHFYLTVLEEPDVSRISIDDLEALKIENISKLIKILEQLYNGLKCEDALAHLKEHSEYLRAGCPLTGETIVKEKIVEVVKEIEKVVYKDKIIIKPQIIKEVEYVEVPVLADTHTCETLPTSSDDKAFLLTTDQENAIKQFEDWWLADSGTAFVIAGVAGSGKSTLVNEIVKRLTNGIGGGEELVPENFAFLTPTGIARDALKRKLKHGLKGRAHTLARYLWFWEWIRHTGEDNTLVNIGPLERFPDVHSEELVELPEENKRKNPDEMELAIKNRWHDRWSGVQIVIVDESSMITKKQFDALSNQSVRLVFIGDPAQLPPVIGEGDDDEPYDILGRANVWLDSVCRQDSNSPILKLAKEIRLNKEVPYRRWGSSAVYMSDKEGHFDSESLRTMVLEHDVILIARNSSRVKLNDRIRELKGFKASLVDYVPKIGEKLICMENNWRGLGGDLVSNGEIFEVIGKATPVALRKNTFMDLDSDSIVEIKPKDYRLRVKRVGLSSPDLVQEGEIYVSSQILRNEHMIGSRKVTEHCTGPLTQKRLEELNDSIGVLRCEWGYVLTVHKAQGSEWNSVLVLCDGQPDRKVTEAQWRYVACTRAVNKLTLLDISPETIRQFCHG
jgi:exodeoxyribonuclease V